MATTFGITRKGQNYFVKKWVTIQEHFLEEGQTKSTQWIHLGLDVAMREITGKVALVDETIIKGEGNVLITTKPNVTKAKQ